jgi:hypothetical protein
MKLLHILKSEPDENTRRLIENLSAGEDSEFFSLYEGDVDYDKLLDLIFEYDRVISWW